MKYRFAIARPTALVIIVTTQFLVGLVNSELVVSRSSPEHCLAAKSLAPGAKLVLAKCDSGSELQNWMVDSGSGRNGSITWQIGDNLCVETSRLFKTKKKPRLNVCQKKKKKQMWRLPDNINKAADDGTQEATIASAKNGRLCIGFSGPNPRTGRNIKLVDCAEDDARDWLWLDYGAYQSYLNPESIGQEEASSRLFYQIPPSDPIPGVSLRTLDPSVIEGYTVGSSGCGDLHEDLYNATLIVANEEIKRNAENYFGDGNGGPIRAPMPEMALAEGAMDKEVASPVAAPSDSDAATIDDSSYGTNNQEGPNVDEADVVKSDGEYVYAAYGDVLVVWDVQGDEMSRTKIPPKNMLAYEEGGYGPYPKPIRPIEVDEEPMASRNEDDGEERRHLRGEPNEKRRRVSMWIPPNPRPRISGLLLYSNRLAVIVTGLRQDYRSDFLERPILTDKDVQVRLYDVSSIPTDGSELPLISSREMSGSYRSARMIGGMAHLAVQSNVDYYPHVIRRLDPWQVTYDGLDKEGYIEAAKEEAKVAAAKFARKLLSELQEIGGTEDCSGVTRVALFASSEENNNNFDEWPDSILSSGVLSSLLQVGTFDMSSNPLQESTTLQMKTAGSFFPSSWAEIYASQNTMIISGRGYNRRNQSRTFEEYTHLLALQLNEDGSAPSGHAIGMVPGYLLNQFSMDEHSGYLRVATTTNAQWGCLDETQPEEEDGSWRPCKWGQLTESKSQLTVLKLPDEDGSSRVMAPVGVVNNLGVTEVIQSARFFDDKAFVVTFRRTDPLYAIDLSDPEKPFRAAELKITGFSSYLHPADGGNKLLAIGSEADETTGRVTGLKITVFDVSDLSEPKAIQNLVINDPWASSEASRDHHSFRFLEGPQLLLIPMSTRNEKEGGPFDGFKVYRIPLTADTDERITEYLGVSMVEDSRMFSRGGWCWYDAYLPPRSMVFSGNAMFIKSHGVVSYDLNTLERRWYTNLDANRSDEDVCYDYWM
mmetsp:Transcript_18794/g.54119  ORF Transcript_18794/g.54119 Transcript_18794/m.54119 type:complete len:990 (+) Transcript_18794:107-3076(+)